MLGEKIISCGMDHSLKIWNFGDQNIQDAVQLSYKVQFNSHIRYRDSVKLSYKVQGLSLTLI